MLRVCFFELIPNAESFCKSIFDVFDLYSVTEFWLNFVSLFLQLGSSTVKAKGSNSGKQISPVVFYGTPHGVPPKRPLSLLRLLREIRVDLSKEDSSNLGYLCNSTSSLFCFKYISNTVGNGFSMSVLAICMFA